MERVFTRDIVDQRGRVKFRAGDARDYHRDVWASLAASLKEDLSAFTVAKDEAARAGAVPSDAPRGPSKTKSRRALTEEAANGA